MRVGALLLLVACRFDVSIPASSRVSCRDNSECVGDTLCDEEFKFCVAAHSPFEVTSPLQPGRGRAGDIFTVGLLAPGRGSEVRVEGLSPSGATVAAFTWDDALQRWTYQALGSEPEGRMRVVASLETGLPETSSSLVSVGALELDFSAPSFSHVELAVEGGDNALVRLGVPELLTAARPGARIGGSFQVSETGATLPGARLMLPDAGVAAVLAVTSAGAQLNLSGIVPIATPDTLLTLRLEAADRVGNRAVVEAVTLPVKTALSTAPDVQSERRVVFHREPWGEAGAPRARYGVSGAAGAALGAAAVAVQLAGHVVGISTVRENGAFQANFDLVEDAPTVEVQAFDSAGNASAVVEVLDIDWTVSALQQDAGVLRESGSLEPWAADWSPHEPSSTWATSGGLRLLQADTGNPYASSVSPLTRTGVLGGFELWSGGHRLTDLSFSALCGSTGGAHTSWAYDLASDRWIGFGDGSPGAFVSPAPDGGVLPPARGWPGLLWPVGWPAALLYGGESQGRTFDDAWRFDGTRFVAVGGPTPAARSRMAIGYDPIRDHILIFGGVDDTGTPLEETWRFTEDAGFSRLGGNQPPARSSASLGWDEARQQVLLVGGVFANGSLATDTWVHDGTAWTELDAGRYHPRMNPVITSLPDLGVTVVGCGAVLPDGGRPNSGAVVDLLTSGWSPAPSSVIEPAMLPATGYHPSRRSPLALGGGLTTENGGDCYCVNDLCNKCWTFSIGDAGLLEFVDWQWRPLGAGAGTTPQVVGGRLSWDSARGHVFLHDTIAAYVPGDPLAEQAGVTRLFNWTEDAGWSSTPLPDGGVTGLARPYSFWDDERRRLLFLGGVRPDGGLSRETWQLDEHGWTALGLGPFVPGRNTFTPSIIDDWAGLARQVNLREYLPYEHVGYRWVAESVTGRTLLPTPMANNLFTDGWSVLPAPPLSSGPVLAQRPSTGAVLALQTGRVLELSGEAWRERRLPALHVEPGDVAMTDPERGQVLVFGARPTRVIDFAGGRPVQEFLVPLERLKVRPGDEVTGATLRINAAALSTAPDGGLLDGVVPLIRLDGRLRTVGFEPGPDGGIQFSTADVRLLRRWLRRMGGLQPDVGVGATSQGTNGPGTAFLETRGLDLTLSYRRRTP